MRSLLRTILMALLIYLFVFIIIIFISLFIDYNLYVAYGFFSFKLNVVELPLNCHRLLPFIQ